MLTARLAYGMVARVIKVSLACSVHQIGLRLEFAHAFRPPLNPLLRKEGKGVVRFGRYSIFSDIMNSFVSRWFSRAATAYPNERVDSNDENITSRKSI